MEVPSEIRARERERQVNQMQNIFWIHLEKFEHQNLPITPEIWAVKSKTPYIKFKLVKKKSSLVRKICYCGQKKIFKKVGKYTISLENLPISEDRKWGRNKFKKIKNI